MVEPAMWCSMKFSCMYCLMVSQTKMKHPLIAIPASGDGDEVDVSFNRSSLSFETASVLSQSADNHHTEVKC